MRPAPSLDVPLPDGRRERAAVAALTGLAAAAVAAWALAWVWAAMATADPPSYATVIGAAAVGMAAGLLVGRRPLPPPRRLRHAAARWWWTEGPSDEDATMGQVELMIDLDFWMLLRLRTPQASDRWFAVDAASAGAQWLALRAVLQLDSRHEHDKAPPEPPP